MNDTDSPDYNDTNQGDCRETQEERDIIRLEKRLIQELKWKQLSVTAVAADNPNVVAYIKQVEDQLAERTRERDEIKASAKGTAKDFELAFRLLRNEHDSVRAERDQLKSELADAKAYGAAKDAIASRYLAERDEAEDQLAQKILEEVKLKTALAAAEQALDAAEKELVEWKRIAEQLREAIQVHKDFVESVIPQPCKGDQALHAILALPVPAAVDDLRRAREDTELLDQLEKWANNAYKDRGRVSLVCIGGNSIQLFTGDNRHVVQPDLRSAIRAARQTGGEA